MTIKKIAGVLLIVALLQSALAPCLAAKDDPAPLEVAGKVTDEQKLPIKHALVVLTQKDAHSCQRTHTNGHGHFTFSHQACGLLNLQVVPPLKSGLAQAVLSDVPGDEGRHVIVSVRRGFLVRGRVLFEGQSVKNATVRVRTQDSDSVHGGGETTTDGKGAFAMVLTPGQKNLEITDITNPQAVGFYKQKYNVIADATMPDIKLPPSKTAGTGQ